MQKNAIQEFPTPEVPLELIHRDGLDMTFESLGIEVSPSPLGFDARIVYKLRGISPESQIALAREITELPEYQGKDFDVIHSYLRRVTVYLRKSEMDYNYGSAMSFAGAVNEHFMGSWRGEYVGTNYEVRYGEILNPNNDLLEGTIFVNAMIPSTKEDLVMAINGFGYFLLQQGIGVQLKDESTPKLYTNAHAERVEMPNFGFVPKGLQYIDLSDWTGEDREYTAEDLKNTDDLN